MAGVGSCPRSQEREEEGLDLVEGVAREEEEDDGQGEVLAVPQRHAHTPVPRDRHPLERLIAPLACTCAVCVVCVNMQRR